MVLLGGVEVGGMEGVMRNDAIFFILANKTEWPVRSGSVRAVKFNKVVL